MSRSDLRRSAEKAKDRDACEAIAESWTVRILSQRVQKYTFARRHDSGPLVALDRASFAGASVLPSSTSISKLSPAHLGERRGKTG